VHSGSALVAACRAAPSALFYPYLRLATLVSSWFDLSNVRYIRYECCPLVRLSWNETDPHFLTGTNIAVYTAETLESISEKNHRDYVCEMTPITNLVKIHLWGQCRMKYYVIRPLSFLPPRRNA